MISALLFFTLALLATAALLCDWRQTAWMSKHYESGLYEVNRYLGPYPSTLKVNVYFLTIGIGYVLVGALGQWGMHQPGVVWATPVAVLYLHGPWVYRNYKNGTKILY